MAVIENDIEAGEAEVCAVCLCVFICVCAMKLRRNDLAVGGEVGRLLLMLAGEVKCKCNLWTRRQRGSEHSDGKGMCAQTFQCFPLVKPDQRAPNRGLSGIPAGRSMVFSSTFRVAGGLGQSSLVLF